jgi:hypothetical protein
MEKLETHCAGCFLVISKPDASKNQLSAEAIKIPSMWPALQQIWPAGRSRCCDRPCLLSSDPRILAASTSIDSINDLAEGTFMTQPYSIAGLEMPYASKSGSLRRILSSALAPPHLATSRSSLMPMLTTSPTKSTGSRPGLKSLPSYWNANYFGFDHVHLFQESSPDEQWAILQRASQGLLQEAYCLEKIGMGYMAQMALLAESIEERMLYTLFAADETRHFVQICPFVTQEPDTAHHPFLHLLSEVLETQTKPILLFVIQVVLEGWGLTHYRTLAKHCCNDELSQVLYGFLQDESRHHGTGVTLFNQTPLSKTDRDTILEVLINFLEMVRVGPLSLVEAIAQVKGPLSSAQRLRILEELDARSHSHTRLTLLQSLISKGNGRAIAQDLENRCAFSILD